MHGAAIKMVALIEKGIKTVKENYGIEFIRKYL